MLWYEVFVLGKEKVNNHRQQKPVVKVKGNSDMIDSYKVLVVDRLIYALPDFSFSVDA
jgi:hypothetical protein